METSPPQEFREIVQNPTHVEHGWLVAAFNAADAAGPQPLTLSEFQRAMHGLGYAYYDCQLREILHATADNGHGVSMLDQFLAQFEGELPEGDVADPVPTYGDVI